MMQLNVQYDKENERFILYILLGPTTKNTYILTIISYKQSRATKNIEHKL